MTCLRKGRIGRLEGAVYVITGEEKRVPLTKVEIKTETKLARITEKVKEAPGFKFTSLMHLMNEEYLKGCYRELKKNKAAGIDGRQVEDYSDEEIDCAISETVEKMKGKRYRPKPVRRVYIRKENGKERALGIPTVIDKVIQQGMLKIMEAIYEPIFMENSYGFRRGRDQHECVKELNHIIMQKKVNWIIDADIKGFFDNVDHHWMITCLEQKIGDPNFKRMVIRFLKAGVMEAGKLEKTAQGTPQGGIISPILGNIYLHYVLDLWFEKKEKQAITGEAHLIRYADDFVIGVQTKRDAEQILNDIRNRLAEFGLSVSEEKTSIKEFGRFAARNSTMRGEGKPKTFDFLGFTHYCTTTRDGRFQVKVKTSRKKLNKAITGMNEWLKKNRNRITIVEIWRMLKLKLRGHYNYYGLSGNFESIQRYYQRTRSLVFKWMNRRSQKKTWNWESFDKYLERYELPKPRITYAIYNTW